MDRDTGYKKACDHPIFCAGEGQSEGNNAARYPHGKVEVTHKSCSSEAVAYVESRITTRVRKMEFTEAEE